MHKVQGVVARGKGQPVTLETVHVPDPGPGEVFGQVQTMRVCHGPALPRRWHQRRLPVPARAWRRGLWSRWATASPMWSPATSWCSTGARSAAVPGLPTR